MNAQHYEQQLLVALANPEQLLVDLDRVDAAESFAAFVKLAWHVLEPDADLAWGWVLDAQCQHAEAVFDGRIKKLLNNVPPGTMKSLIWGVMFPAWVWTKRPSARFLCCSHSFKLAERDSLKFRRLVSSPWYQARWPVKLMGDQNTKMKIENDSTGIRECNAFTSVTGLRADFLILDDPLSVNGAESAAERWTAEFTFRNTFYNRSTGAGTAMVVIMQRVHERDTAGVILDLGLPFDHLCLPMEFDPDRRCSTSIGFDDPREDPGELLFPELFPTDRVDDLRAGLDSYSWAGQYQQTPSPRGAGFLKPHLIELVDDWPRNAVTCRRWDPANTPGSGDWMVGLKMAFLDGQGWIIDVWREKPSPSEGEAAMLSCAELDGIGTSIVVEQEPGSSGKWFVQTMQRKLAGYAVYPSRPDQKKEVRAKPLAAAIEAGNIKMVRAPWNRDLVDEFATFPAGAHDDIVDCAADAWLHLSHGLFSSYMYVG